jgi:addiction module RelE/StbE family toxin
MKILWTDIAEQDLSEIIEFIAINNLNVATRILREIKNRVSSLNENSAQGRIVPELKKYNIVSYRELILTPWRILYKIEKSAVFILCVMDSRRNIEDILLNRLLRGEIR